MHSGDIEVSRTADRADLRLEVLDRLTKREREVLLMLADGLTNQHLANQLGIAERTVRAHLFSIVQKLGVQSRLQAALLADRHRAALIP